MESPTSSLLQEGISLHRQGALAEAVQRYLQVLRTDTANIDARHYLAMAALQQGRFAEAEGHVRLVLTNEPKHVRAHHLLGVILHRLGRREEALASFDQAVMLQPDFADGHGNRGNVLSELRRLPEAVESYDRAVALQPDSIAHWCNRGAALHELERYAEAIACFDRAIVLKPDFAEAHCNRANSLARLARHDEAVAGYDRALALNPRLLDALNNRGAALKSLSRYEEALASFEAALRTKPDFADAHNNLGNVQQALDRPADAIRSYEAAVALRPNDAQIHNNLGNALQLLNRYDDAIAHYETAIRLKPDYAEAHSGLGAVLQAVGRDDEAVQSYDRAIGLKQDYDEAKWNKGLLCLSLGRFAEGWPLYEYRWKTIGHERYSERPWNGEPLSGTLLIWGEQGVGDEIVYSSMIPDVVGYAPSVVLEVEPRLVTLFSRSFPDVTVIGGPGPPYDGRFEAQAPIGGLGKYLRTDWNAFPRGRQGYLIADAGRTAGLRRRLPADTVVGLSWSSQAAKFGKAKSAALRDFEPILRLPGCSFVDLQYGDTTAERAALERATGIRIQHLDDIDNTRDIDGLASLIAACDLVVTVSNATAHLAGALGKPTWVLVPHGNARLWYWFKDGEDSPWYPHVRLRRQSFGQPWNELLASVADEISAFCNSNEARAARN
jgi:tetratricopeptide (TPR) repeat protein